jgi:hypothetical protein
LAIRLAGRRDAFFATFLTGFFAAFFAAFAFTLRAGFFAFATGFFLAFFAMAFSSGMGSGAIYGF